MNAPSPSSHDIFDVRKIRRLVELMKEHNLNEIDLQQGDVRIQLRRSGDTVLSAGGPQIAWPANVAGCVPVAPAAVGPPAPESDTATGAESKAENFAVIKSPMVGTFYAAPDPESPPFVKVGDHIGRETTVCIVEAMKVFNQIPAEVSGRIVATLVENGEPVEFGQPLFKVNTRE